MSKEKSCFVLMPFHQKYVEVYEQVYKPVCAANNIICWRVDEVNRPGSITHDIVEGIIDSDIIIADLTSKNPNVFYELGIAHSTGNKTIMTGQVADEIPFDIANYRIILYEQTITGSKFLAKQLDSAIKELLVALERTNNPVQTVLAGRSSMRFPRKIPLFEAVDFKFLPKPIREYFTKHNIILLDDLKEIKIEDFINKQGFGKTSLSILVYLLYSFGFTEAPQVNNLLQQNIIRFTGNDWSSKAKWENFIESVQKFKKSNQINPADAAPQRS